MSEPITDAVSAPAVDVAALQAQVASLLAENADLKLRAAGVTAGLVPQSYLDAVNNDLAKAKEQIAALQAATPAVSVAPPEQDPVIQEALSKAHDMLIAAQQKQTEDAATIASLQQQVTDLQAKLSANPPVDTGHYDLVIKSQQETITQLQAQVADATSKLKQAGDMAAEYKDHAAALEASLNEAEAKLAAPAAPTAPADVPTVRLIAPDVEVVTLGGVIDVRLSADGGQTLYRILQTTTQDGFHRAASPAIAEVLNGKTITQAPSGVGAAA